MKKLTLLLLTTAFFCGCAEEKKEDSRPEPATFDAASYEKQEDCIDVARRINYDSLEEFKSSLFISEMKNSGYTPYYLEYDEERYSVKSLSSDVHYYVYNLYDSVEDKSITYTIIYNIDVDSVQDFAEVADNYEKDVITTAQRNGVTYDVYLSTSPYNFVPDNPEPVLDYGLLYIPFPEYEASIFVSGETTTDEILSYFDDFELVPEG